MKNIITKKDLDDLQQQIERIKNDPVAQENIRLRLLELKTTLRQLEESRKIDPAILQQPMTI
jgi:hypothetical protein